MRSDETDTKSLLTSISCFLNQDVLFLSCLLRERRYKPAISSCTFNNVSQFLCAVHLGIFKLALFKENYFCILSNLMKRFLILTLFLMSQKMGTRKGTILFCL